MSCIQSDLYLGGVEELLRWAATRPDPAKSAVLSFQGDDEWEMNIEFLGSRLDEQDLKTALESLKLIPTLRFTIDDSENEDISLHFNESIQFIENNTAQGRLVFVHCQMGISRSPSIVLAYLMKKWHKNCFDVLKFVRGKREDVRPNTTFLYNLLQQQRAWGIEPKVELLDEELSLISTLIGRHYVPNVGVSDYFDLDKALNSEQLAAEKGEQAAVQNYILRVMEAEGQLEGQLAEAAAAAAELELPPSEPTTPASSTPSEG